MKGWDRVQRKKKSKEKVNYGENKEREARTNKCRCIVLQYETRRIPVSELSCVLKVSSPRVALNDVAFPGGAHSFGKEIGIKMQCNA